MRDTVMKTLNVAHQGVLKLSGGRIGWTAGKMPVVRLTTTGRQSGSLREVMLTSPMKVGDAWVVVASKGGDPAHPAWFLNLRADPNVWVETGDEPRHERIARVATADERAELWPNVIAAYPNYAGYQAKVDREIPLVLLEPTA